MSIMRPENTLVVKGNLHSHCVQQENRSEQPDVNNIIVHAGRNKTCSQQHVKHLLRMEMRKQRLHMDQDLP